MRKEEWKPIAGYEGLYEVSNYGQVASLNYRKKGERVILKLSAKTRYIKVTLRDANGKWKTHWVHRLVGLAFLPPPKKGEKQIDHIDGNKQSNVVWNLRWASPKQNISNPNTKPNMSRRYHRQGEFERRSAAQKQRMQEHPEDLIKMWNGWKRWRNGLRCA